MGCYNIELSEGHYESSFKGISIWPTFNKDTFHLTKIHVTDVDLQACIRF